MFIYSLRASTLKFFGIVVLALVILVSLVVFIPPLNLDTQATGNYTQTNKVTYEKVKTNEDRINFLRQFGWEVESEPVEEHEVTIPAEFNRIFAGYNYIQQSQGLDLSKYKNKTLTRYTYKITNYPDYDGTVYANLLIFRGRVVGGDVCTADRHGFVKGFSGK